MAGSPGSLEELLQKFQIPSTSVEGGTSGDALTDLLKKFQGAPQPEQPSAEDIKGAESGPTGANPNLVRQAGKVHAQPTGHEQYLSDLSEAISTKLGGALDTKKAARPGLDFWMARSQSAEDVKAKFENSYPDGDLMQVTLKDGSKTFVFREDKDQPWGMVGGTPAWAAGKVVTPEFAGGVVTALRTRGLSLPARVVAQGIAGAAGSATDYGIERLAGYDKEKTTGQVVGDMAMSAGTSMVGETLPNVAANLKTLYSKAREGGVRSVLSRETEFGAPYVKAAEEEGLPLPGRGQISGDPKVQTIFNQTANVSSVARNLLNEQKSGLQKSLERRAADTDYDSLTGPQLQRLVDEQEKTIEKMVAKPGGTTAAEADEAIQAGVSEWQESKRRDFSRRLKKITDIAKAADIEFDFGQVQKVARDIERGIIANTTDPEMVGVQLATPIGALAKKAQIITQMESTVKTGPRVGGKADDPITQLISLRDDAFDLMNRAKGRDKELATQLYNSIKDTMERPITANPKSVLPGNLRTYLDDYAQYEEKTALFRKMMDAEDPGGLANKLFSPGKYESLKAFKEMSPEKFAEAKDAFVTRLFENPGQIASELDRFKKTNNISTLRLFMDEAEEGTWRAMANERAAWEKSIPRQVARTGSTGRMNAQQILFGTVDDPTKIKIDEIALEDFLRSTVGGKGGQEARDLRAGIFAALLNHAKKTSGEAAGEQVINPKSLVTMIDGLTSENNKRVLDSLMRPQDWRALENFRRYATMIGETTPSPELSSGQRLLRLINPVNVFMNPHSYSLTIASLMNQDHLARILAEPVTSDMLMKSIELGGTPAGIRLFGAAAAQATKEATRDYPSNEKKQ